MGVVDNLTHDEIGEIGAKKLRSMGYIAAFSNMSAAATSEQPDVLGLKSCGETFLVEVKVSRSDFFADKKKSWRGGDSKALGNFRAYLTPKALIKPEEVPYGWQLWEIHGKNKPVIKILKGRYRGEYLSCTGEEYRHFYNKSLCRGALGWMAIIFSRMLDDGIDIQQYASRKGKGFLKQG